MRARRNFSGLTAIRTLCALAVLTQAASCAGRTSLRTTAPDAEPLNVGDLWVAPDDVAARDLFFGPGGATLAPAESASYDLVAVDATGYSPGYDVRDRDGTAWSVKLGAEAQSEIVASRVLWAIGYHQPAVYLVKDWELTGQTRVKPGPARFRRELPTHKVVSEWSWYENPFVETPAFRGLVVANLILNNWDWKTSNNKLYEVADGTQVRRMYVVRDLGASLGKTSFPALLRWPPFTLMAQGSRNNVADFEEQRFIRSVDGDDVTFEYRGVHTGLVGMLTAADVAWTCRLMDRISDRQWRDAFRAAGYGDAEQERFIAKLKAKIREGLATAAG